MDDWTHDGKVHDAGTAHFDVARREVHLGSRETSRSTHSHEQGHYAMYKAYNWNNIHAGNWKNVDCSGHMIHRIKSTECAWQEGWATYFMLDVWNTKRYNFSDGSWYDLEVRSSSSGNFFEATDACEGNVAATLLDLIDPYNDGFDAADFETRHTWKVLRRGLQNTTAEYYQAWGLQGYDQAKFRGAAKQNTINY